MPSLAGTDRSRMLRRATALALLLGLAGAGAGFAYGHASETSHEAVAVVLVHPTEGNPFSPESGDDLVNLATEAELVTSDAVGRAVARQEPGVALPDVLGAVSVVVPANTQLLEITVTHRDAGLARERAQSFADSYLDYRRTRTTSTLFDRAAQVTEQTRVAEASLTDAVARLSKLGPLAPERPQLEQQVDVLTAQVAQLRTEQAAVRATAREPGEVITPAALSGVGPLATTTWATAAGALVGIAGGVAWTLARVRRGDRVDALADLTAAGHDVLGHADKPTEVRARVLVSDPRRPLVVLVAGTDAGTSPSVPRAEELAHCFARAQLETVHLDLAPRTEVLGTGLVDVLHEVAVVDDALKHTAPHLSTVVATGGAPVAADLNDLVAAPAAAGVFDDLRKRCDVVLITGVDMADPVAHQLLAHVDLLVPWVTARRSTVAGLQHAMELARAAGVDSSGVVYDPARPARQVAP